MRNISPPPDALRQWILLVVGSACIVIALMCITGLVFGFPVAPNVNNSIERIGGLFVFGIALMWLSTTKDKAAAQVASALAHSANFPKDKENS